MVGRKAAELSLPLPPAILERIDDPRHRAEASLHAGRPEHLGVRLLFDDDRWTDALGLPVACREASARLRAAFELVPGDWVRLHYEGGQLRGFGLDHVVMPHCRYPITTLRVAMRRLGFAPRYDIEALLAEPLDHDATQWGFSIRWEGDAPVGGRIFGRMPRHLLDGVMSNVHALAAVPADGFDAWRSLPAGDHVYVSIDPTDARACAVDFENVETGALRGGDAIVEVPAHSRFRYVKARLADPMRWTGYVPWWTFKLWWEMARAPRG